MITAPPVTLPKGSTQREDDQGVYIHYHRTCNQCSVELTSRNRTTGGAVLCKSCAAANAREKAKEKREMPQAAPKASPVATPTKQDAQAKLRGLFYDFLCFPTTPAIREDLLAGLTDYELIIRFRDIPDQQPNPKKEY